MSVVKPLRKEIEVRHGTTVLRTIVIVHAEPPLNGFRILELTSQQQEAVKAAIPSNRYKDVAFTQGNDGRNSFASADPNLIQKAIDALRENAVSSLLRAREEVKRAKAEERAKIAKLRKTMESFK